MNRLLACMALLLVNSLTLAGTEPLTYQELMKFRQIEDASISADGSWIAYTLEPDRGDYEAVARTTVGDREYRIQGGADCELSKNSKWLACEIPPSQKERDEADGDDDDGPRSGMALLSLTDGAETRFEEVESFELSEDGQWIAWQRYKEKADDEGSDEEEAPAQEEASEEEEGEEEEEEEEDDENRPLGATLVLRELGTDGDVEIPHVIDYGFDEPSRFLVYTQAAPWGEGNGIYVRRLEDRGAEPAVLHSEKSGRYTELEWTEKSSRLAFVASVDDDLHDPGPADVWTWDGAEQKKPKLLATSKKAPEGWRIPSENELTWSRDGERLFFGYQRIDPVREERRLKEKEEERKEKQESEQDEDDEGDDEPYDPFDVDALIEERSLDVWHWNDPYIIPHQKKQWDATEEDRVYLAVGHVDEGKVVRLADLAVPDVEPSDNPRAALATSDLPYRKLRTWDGAYGDVFHVDLEHGEARPVATGLRGPEAEISPGGRFVAYWNDPHWYLWDADTGTTRNLTENIDVPFANEDDDYPAPDPGYGIADWVEGDRAVLIHDKFDLWRFPTDGSAPVNLTGGEGRKARRQFRLEDLDPDVDHVADDERLLLHGYHDRKKNDGFWETTADKPALRKLLEEDRRFRMQAKAEDADALLYTRESYREFPDLWTSDLDLSGRRILSDANPQIDRFAWGYAELVEWTSADGIPLQGVLIKPGNYEPGKRYPVLVYFYRFFSQRLHQFNEPVINHRPSFPMYASNGYAVFLPDVRFETGRPGSSAVKALVPGVQKLVDMGIADPDAIGLHGHSWSGYQAAYVVTQTDIFAATVAGALVSNMTSAYSGIRLGSGMARQFQYEQSQSRIGASMDADLPKYIENSPVFHARHIETPLLIQFGDEDEAVPWQQGIELYLAMRRLEKDVVFLQYRGEPHHLKQYPNKLDYSIKMMQFFDHHLKGGDAPDWITQGVPYRGD